MTIDASNMLKVIEEFAQQCKIALGLPKGMSVSGKVDNIVIAGMGGSAIGGDILRSMSSKIPVFVVRDYNLPDFVSENTLVFAVSYSGNTEETISAFEDAQRKKAKIIAVTSGGLISTMAKKVIKVPQGIMPRAALGYLFFPMLGVLVNSRLIAVSDDEIKEMLDVLSDVEYFKAKGQEIAQKINSRTPLIYSSELLKPVAYRWKTQLNENSKVASFCHSFSELCHNEIVGYQTAKRDRFVSIFIRDLQDNERIKKRMNITKDIILTKVDVEEVFTKGGSLLARMFFAIYLGDFASYYLALSNKIDPTAVSVIENLKKRLKE